MKTKKLKEKDLIAQSDSELLRLVATKLKDKVLFPEKLESTRKYIGKVKSSVL